MKDKFSTEMSSKKVKALKIKSRKEQYVFCTNFEEKIGRIGL